MAELLPTTNKPASTAKSPAFPPFISKRAMACAYGFTFAFMACTVLLVLNPSPLFKNFFHTSFYSSSSSSRSHYFSIFSNHFFPNSSLHNFQTHLPFSPPPNTQFQFSGKTNGSKESDGTSLSYGDESLKGNGADFPVSLSSPEVYGKAGFEKKQTEPFNGEGDLRKNGSGNGVLEMPRLKSYAAEASEALPEKQIKQSWLEVMNDCNVFEGKWMRDDSYPLYAPGSCPHIDEPFNCFINGRSDNAYEKYRWQPKDCNLPRFNGSDMLGLLRGKRLVFVGDSLNRNMWESLVCILRNSAEDKSRVFEVSGRLEFRTEGSYSFIFKDYNCSVEFFRSPFLIQEWEIRDTNGSKKETLRLDVIERSSDRYNSADVLIFNTGHWWTHEKTSRGRDYYQEGSHIYRNLNVKEAFQKALRTWARWVDANINPKKTLVFFRGYSPSHFRDGSWNSGGQCDSETEPIKEEARLARYPRMMSIIESVMKEMKTSVFYLNITRMSDFRIDAHPSVYRKQNLSEEDRRSPLRYQDCSHWCLPGVPDTWNELIYAQLLMNQDLKQQQHKHHQEQQQKRP